MYANKLKEALEKTPSNSMYRSSELFKNIIVKKSNSKSRFAKTFNKLLDWYCLYCLNILNRLFTFESFIIKLDNEKAKSVCPWQSDNFWGTFCRLWEECNLWSNWSQMPMFVWNLRIHESFIDIYSQRSPRNHHYSSELNQTVRESSDLSWIPEPVSRINWEECYF